MPGEAVRNLQRLQHLGALGRYGYYDSVEFTPSRVPAGSDHAIIRNYYAHHHGMSIIAINNVVFNGHMRERFHLDPVIEAAELLLQEKAPREIPVMHAKIVNPMRSDADGFKEVSMRIIKMPLNPTALNPDHVKQSVQCHADGKRLGLQPLEPVRHHALSARRAEDQQGARSSFCGMSHRPLWRSLTGEPTPCREQKRR